MVLIAAQAYFTLQNYRVNQQRFVNDVQIALDLGVESYFSDQARTSIKIFTMDIPEKDTTFLGHRIQATISASEEIDSPIFIFDTTSSSYTYKWATGKSADSMRLDSIIEVHNTASLSKISIQKDRETLSNNFKKLTDKVMLSFSEDLLDLGKLYNAVQEELSRKKLDIQFALQQESNGRNTTIGEAHDSFLTTKSKSSYLGSRRSLQIKFENATLSILKRGLADLSLSVLLIGLVIGTMLYLYRTISQQKQLAEIKDDLISNITHEFKTPIATIYSALEGVTNFNEANDPEKTKKYLTISNHQLSKLNSMVEKLLETATIDKGRLKLNREELELVSWTREIVQRFTMMTGEKAMKTDFEMQSYVGSIDAFHLENVISNLIDNAIKYGGNEIVIRMKQVKEHLVWEVEDNGEGIPKHAQDRIFEKLYRVPKGNTHDVKGFGIGLYYAKTIAELHDGSLQVKVDHKRTTFELIL